MEDEPTTDVSRRYIGTKVITARPEQRDGKDGYGVRYADGYTSWSPKDVFEEAYRLCDAMTFGLAIEAMKKGEMVRLPKWSPDVFISVQTPESRSEMTAPYFYVTSRFGRVAWIPTMIEMFSEEWAIVA